MSGDPDWPRKPSEVIQPPGQQDHRLLPIAPAALGLNLATACRFWRGAGRDFCAAFNYEGDTIITGSKDNPAESGNVIVEILRRAAMCYAEFCTIEMQMAVGKVEQVVLTCGSKVSDCAVVLSYNQRRFDLGSA